MWNLGDYEAQTKKKGGDEGWKLERGSTCLKRSMQLLACIDTVDGSKISADQPQNIESFLGSAEA
jgi:hypothetical protein